MPMIDDGMSQKHRTYTGLIRDSKPSEFDDLEIYDHAGMPVPTQVFVKKADDQIFPLYRLFQWVQDKNVRITVEVLDPTEGE